ncbi:MAG: GntR family transcriptional regulator [Pseudomonadota bacterium]
MTATYTKDSCLEDLRRRILSTELSPGADLDEATLSGQYGISRTPLREVLQRLGGAGYVSLTANRGAKVASMDISTMRVFFQTAPMIYANISRLAAENRRPAQVDALRVAQAQFASASDTEATALANHSFHRIIGEMAENPYLMACLERLLIDHTRLSQTFYRPTSEAEAELIAQASAQHDALIEAIAGSDAAQAVDLTLAHWDLSRDRMERFVRPDPLPVDVMTERSHAV